MNVDWKLMAIAAVTVAMIVVGGFFFYVILSKIIGRKLTASTAAPSLPWGARLRDRAAKMWRAMVNGLRHTGGKASSLVAAVWRKTGAVAEAGWRKFNPILSACQVKIKAGMKAGWMKLKPILSSTKMKIKTGVKAAWKKLSSSSLVRNVKATSPKHAAGGLLLVGLCLYAAIKTKQGGEGLMARVRSTDFTLLLYSSRWWIIGAVVAILVATALWWLFTRKASTPASSSGTRSRSKWAPKALALGKVIGGLALVVGGIWLFSAVVSYSYGMVYGGSAEEAQVNTCKLPKRSGEIFYQLSPKHGEWSETLKLPPGMDLFLCPAKGVETVKMRRKLIGGEKDGEWDEHTYSAATDSWDRKPGYAREVSFMGDGKTLELRVY